MAFITTSEVKSIRVALKKRYPNLRFSVKQYDHMKVSVTIMKGNLDFSKVLGREKYVELNHNYPKNYGEHQQLIENITTIIKNAPGEAGGQKWFDKSDVQSDYFETAFYFNINIGTYDKEYEKV